MRGVKSCRRFWQVCCCVWQAAEADGGGGVVVRRRQCKTLIDYKSLIAASCRALLLGFVADTCKQPIL